MTQSAVSVTQRLLTVMLKASMLWGHAALLAVTGIGWWWAGAWGAGNAAVGGALVVFFFAAGQGVQLLAGELEPRLGLAVTLTSYLARVVVLGGLLLVATRSSAIEQGFRPGPFVLGVFTVLTAWIGGMFWAHAHSRVPVFDHLDEPRSNAGRSE